MYTQNKKPSDNNRESAPIRDGTSMMKRGNETTFQFVVNRPETITQRKRLEMANCSLQPKQVVQFQYIQKKENNTGLSDNLKSGIENLSGYSMDDVNVHYNSNKPAQLQAHAYAQGTDIHLAAGQQKHLPHEAWHVVQQKQGRVKPTTQLKEKVAINDDVGLEKEADVMSAKAVAVGSVDVEPGELIIPNRVAQSHQLKVAQLVRVRISIGKIPEPSWLYQYSDQRYDYYESAPKFRRDDAHNYIKRTKDEWEALEQDIDGDDDMDDSSSVDPDEELNTYQDSLLSSSSHLILSPSSKAHYLDPEEQDRIPHSKNQKQASVYHRSKKHAFFAGASTDELTDMTVRIKTTSNSGMGVEAHQGLYPNTFSYLSSRLQRPTSERESELEEENGGSGELYDEALLYKLSLCENVANNVGKLSYLTAGVYNNYPLVMVHIDLDEMIAQHPKKSSIGKVTAATKKAFTSFLMNYYLGIVNYLSAAAGLNITMVERSSFGFFTPSIAETGESFRINLGIMPAGYAGINTHALHMLNQQMEDIVAKGVDRSAKKHELDTSDKYLSKKKGQIDKIEDWFEYALFGIESRSGTSVYNLARKRERLDAINAMSFNLMAMHKGKVSGLGTVLAEAFGLMRIKNGKFTTDLGNSSYSYKVPSSGSPYEEDSELAAQHDDLLALFRRNVAGVLDKTEDEELRSHLTHLSYQLTSNNPNLEEAIDLTNELLLILSQKPLEETELGSDKLDDGYGSESDVEESDGEDEMEELSSSGPRLLTGKKIIVHNGMRALLTSIRATKGVLFKGEKQVILDAAGAYYELDGALKDSNIPTKKLSGKETPHILIRDINACVTASVGTFKPSKVASEIQNSTALVWIIDTTSATQAQMKTLLEAFRISKARVLFMVSSGFKQEQLGSDRNPYGTARIFTDKVDIQFIEPLMNYIKTVDKPLAPTSHLYRRLLKEMGATPRNREILGGKVSSKSGKKKAKSKVDWLSIIGKQLWLPSHKRSPEQIRTQQMLQTFVASLELVDAQDDEHDERADHSQHAREFINLAPSVERASRVSASWLTRTPNAGGGDCLLYSLAGANLSFEEILALRGHIAGEMAHTLPDQVSGNSIYMSLYQSGYMNTAMEARLDSRHQVPRAVYQNMVQIPGLYAGEDEIRAWMRYKDIENVTLLHN